MQRGPVGKVGDLARFVAKNHTDHLRLAEVARHVRLHPNYAMTLFRRHYGMTLSAYLTRLRVCLTTFAAAVTLVFFVPLPVLIFGSVTAYAVYRLCDREFRKIDG